MEIALLPDNGLKIKGKQVTFVVDSLSAKGKLSADAVLLLGTSQTKDLFSEGLGVVFQGPGEYEIKGAKVTGFRAEGETMYTLSIDGVSVLVGKVTSAAKAKDKLHEHDVAVLMADEMLPQAIMGVMNPSVVSFYGEKAVENTKSFGGENITPVGKYVTTKDKLPSEKELVVLG
ncbi:MAG TPA: hypothetical protein VF189_04170 [Patescibacteria group bacterium]